MHLPVHGFTPLMPAQLRQTLCAMHSKYVLYQWHNTAVLYAGTDAADAVNSSRISEQPKTALQQANCTSRLEAGTVPYTAQTHAVTHPMHNTGATKHCMALRVIHHQANHH
jgi:hypothetical protein